MDNLILFLGILWSYMIIRVVAQFVIDDFRGYRVETLEQNGRWFEYKIYTDEVR